MSLRDKGWRFIYRGGEFKWTHPYDLEKEDVDCTEMNDDEFMDFFVRTS